MSDDVCDGFEPQNYLRERCKKCFRLKSKHSIVSEIPQLPPISPTTTMPQQPTSSSIASPTSSISNRSNKEKRNSWRDFHLSDGVTSPEYESEHNTLNLPSIQVLAAESNLTETSSVFSFKSANSRLLSNAKSMESILSNTDDRCSMVSFKTRICLLLQLFR